MAEFYDMSEAKEIIERVEEKLSVLKSDLFMCDSDDTITDIRKSVKKDLDNVYKIIRDYCIKIEPEETKK